MSFASGIDSGHPNDARLMLLLPLLQPGSRVACATSLLVDFLMTPVTYQEKIFGAVQLPRFLRVRSTTTRAVGRERVNMRFLGPIDLFLCDWRFVEQLVAVAKLTATTGEDP